MNNYVARILIHREGYYGSGSRPDPTRPLHCMVETIGDLGKVELNLPQEASDRIVALIAEELAAAARATAEAMTASFINAQPLLAG